MTRHDLMLACPVLPHKVRHTVRTDLGDCCAPMPSGALSARVEASRALLLRSGRGDSLAVIPLPSPPAASTRVAD